MVLKYLLEKEFKHILRNPIIPRVIVAMPIMMMILLPFAANLEVFNINVAVVDNDHTITSSRLTDQISASNYFQLTATPQSYDQAMIGIEEGTTDIILTIPSHFGRDLELGKLNSPAISANAVDAIKASMGSQYLQSIVTQFALDHFPVKVTPELEVASQYRFNPFLNYKFFMVPALMVMLLTIMCGFLPALNIVQEKEEGSIEQINVSPISKTNFIISKIFPFWVVGYIVLTISFIIAWLLYSQIAVGSYLTIYASAFIFLLVISGMGLLISSNSATMQQSMFVMFFFVIIMLLLSGLFTPVASMPGWAQWIATFNPLTYFIRIMRAVYLKGANLIDIRTDLLILSAFALVFDLWAILSYRKKG